MHLASKTQEEFRRYYNHTIHPELLRMERKRRRLLLLFFISVLLLFGLLIVGFYVDLLLINLSFFLIVFFFYLPYVAYAQRRFVTTFKPKVVNLILDFLGDGEFRYDHSAMLPKNLLDSSRLFVTDAPLYEGEDFIEGKVGDVAFSLCELNVREYSPVRNRLNYVFRGIFLHAKFPRAVAGKILVLPSRFSQYLVRTVKAFNREGGKPNNFKHTKFNEVFNIYATSETYTGVLLSEEVQETILSHREKTGNEVYLSFIDGEMYVALSEPRDILEPHIFTSNVSYELVRQFYEDIELLLNIIDDFDRNH